MPPPGRSSIDVGHHKEIFRDAGTPPGTGGDSDAGLALAMQSIFNVVLPVFAIILTGFLAGRFRFLGDDSSEALNRFVYYVALPVLLFHSMARVEPAVIFDWPFMAAYVGGLLITLSLAMAWARCLFGGRLAENALFAMATVFGNTGYMGIPLALTAFGAEGALPAILATVINGALLIAIIVTIIEIDLSVDGGMGVVRDVGRALARNPLLLSPLAGIAWAFTGIALPAPVDTFCTILGAAAGPCALFAIGLFLARQSPGEAAREVGSMTIFKLLVHPAVTWVLAVMVLEVKPLWATVAVIMAALPTGANVFVLAQRYGIYVQRSSAAILVSTVLSVITLSVLFSVWRGTGLE